MGDYVPQAPVNDEAKKRNEKLPGMGGVFNTVNLHVYHYAGNNPIKYVDPDGKDIEELPLGSASGGFTATARISFGIAKDSNSHIAIYTKVELGIGAGFNITPKGSLGVLGKILNGLDKTNTYGSLLGLLDTPKDTGKGNFDTILNINGETFESWDGNLPIESCCLIGVKADKKGRLSPDFGAKIIVAAYMTSRTVYFDITGAKNEIIDTLKTIKNFVLNEVVGFCLYIHVKGLMLALNLKCLDVLGIDKFILWFAPELLRISTLEYLSEKLSSFDDGKYELENYIDKLRLYKRLYVIPIGFVILIGAVVSIFILFKENENRKGSMFFLLKQKIIFLVIWR